VLVRPDDRMLRSMLRARLLAAKGEVGQEIIPTPEETA